LAVLLVPTVVDVPLGVHLSLEERQYAIAKPPSGCHGVWFLPDFLGRSRARRPLFMAFIPKRYVVHVSFNRNA
jgi:hypothetical protein